MKVRTSHVTNSSSSSFIIAYSNMPEFDKETLSKYPFLKTYGCLIEKILMATGDNDTSEGERFSNKDEVGEHILDCYSWRRNKTLEEVLEDDEWAKEEYDLMMEYINKGYNILQKSIDYCDDALVGLIEHIDDGENVTIVGRYD